MRLHHSRGFSAAFRLAFDHNGSLWRRHGGWWVGSGPGDYAWGFPRCFTFYFNCLIFAIRKIILLLFMGVFTQTGALWLGALRVISIATSLSENRYVRKCVRLFPYFTGKILYKQMIFLVL